MALSIKPLNIGRLRLDKGLMTYFENYGEKIWIPINAWLIKSPQGNILVDTGAYAEDMKNYWHDKVETVQTCEKALAKENLKPEDIDILILTQLHFDHCLNARLFKNATVYVQKKEYEFMKNPHPMMAGLYNPKFIEGLKLKIVDGEEEIVPGVKVIPVPGHTVGTQAVAVQTAKGLAVITGFCCISEIFNVPGNGVIPPGIHVDALLAFDSAVKVKKIADWSGLAKLDTQNCSFLPLSQYIS
jgi:N-acyl homoserine lactone hydrolase